MSTEHPAIQRAVGRPSLKDIVRIVARQTSSASLEATRQRSLGRMLSSWLGVHEALRPLCEVASALGLRSPGHISTLARRCELSLPRDRVMRKLLRCCLDELREKAPPLVQMLPRPLPDKRRRRLRR